MPNTTNSALIAELSTLARLFVTEHMSNGHCAWSITQHVSVWNDITPELFSWCCFHGFSLRRIFKKTAARKKWCIPLSQEQGWQESTPFAQNSLWNFFRVDSCWAASRTSFERELASSLRMVCWRFSGEMVIPNFFPGLQIFVHRRAHRPMTSVCCNQFKFSINYFPASLNSNVMTCLRLEDSLSFQWMTTHIF